ncbi:TadE/TadG family type IV pilus assembly protein [Paraburkholderia sp.]|uniref:TadE family protein n=1 Tax=Paraburkholderia sp. TaxID=1926495 RepID=UPI00239D5864|nr:TadE/TadG family type IV pilus assembly protein [Paraburkholderia sp.]MDE1184638.1 TadE/TadG family type IV pilus assembly protein [Paraburkholderia sp.]
MNAATDRPIAPKRPRLSTGSRASRDSKPSRRTSRGSSAVEFAMIFPLFFVLMYGLVSFSLIFVLKQNMTMAAEEGARAALNWKQASTIATSLTLRQSAACTAATAALATFTGKTITCNTQTAAGGCTYDPTLECVSVTLKYHYSSDPLLPALPILTYTMPDWIVSSATVQLNPQNML